MSLLSVYSVMKPDISFNFEDSDQKLMAHKFILSTLSPVFRAQFSGKYEDSSFIYVTAL